MACIGALLAFSVHPTRCCGWWVSRCCKLDSRAASICINCDISCVKQSCVGRISVFSLARNHSCLAIRKRNGCRSVYGQRGSAGRVISCACKGIGWRHTNAVLLRLRVVEHPIDPLADLLRSWVLRMPIGSRTAATCSLPISPMMRCPNTGFTYVSKHVRHSAAVFVLL